MHRAVSFVLTAAILVFAAAAGRAGSSLSGGTDNRAAADAPYGIAKRVPWTTSRITGSLDPPAPYRIRRVFPNLKFNQPVDLAPVPGTDRLLVMELEGKVYTFPDHPQVEQPTLFVDLAEHIPDFRRAYGIAFHPEFEQNRYVYLCYVMKDGDPKGTRVSRFVVKNAGVAGAVPEGSPGSGRPGFRKAPTPATPPPVLDPKTETVVIEWYAGGHNGGCLKFGPDDGYLYISTGDGTPPAPPDGFTTGQDISDLLASVLRIDVDHPDPGKAYGIPADNPFVDLDGARPEIWAYGLRNPWRMSFDPDGRLWVGDVGWEMWEMIYLVRRGGNYGWSIVEGPQSVRPEIEQGPTPILPPVAAHSHIESRSVTGGYVYRGRRLGQLRGAYIYGDYVTGKIWGLRHDGNEVTWKQELVDSPLAVIVFGEDRYGELYVVDYAGGIYELVPNPNATANRDFPRKLSRTGLFASLKDHRPAPGVIPYSINAEPWKDGAVAERFIAIPGAPKLQVWKESNTQVGNIRGNWKYPTDTVFAKTLSLPIEADNLDSARRVETQILHRDGDTWRAYTYVWNDQQTDATLAPAEGMEKTFTIVDPDAPGGRRQQTWHVSGRTECLVCHTTRGGSIYGFIPPQLNRDHDYGQIVDNQLRTLAHIGLFDDPYAKTPENPEHRPYRIPDPLDGSLDLNERARAYVYVNCGTCHRRGGGGTAKFELLYHKPLRQLTLLDERPTQGTFKIHDARNVAPGDPYRSVLYYRMAALGAGHMPKLGSNLIDRNGLRLIHDWIGSLHAEGSNGDSSVTAELRARQRTALKRLEQQADAAERSLQELLSTTTGALMLATAVDAGRFDESARERILDAGSSHPSAVIRDLFERFLPEEKRVKRLGTVVEPSDILSLPGDADRGKSVFFELEGVQCRNCHRIGDDGRQLGPDLTEIGKKYDRAQLLETILEPSKKIEKQYLTYLVQTSQGQVHTGLLVKRGTAEVVLKNNEAEQVRIPAGQIELVVPQRKSLMPELLLRDMTAQQVADLLAYLQSLK